jgi:glutamine---fructose-6-phosphate transaminase (isomerizing)
MCSVVGYVGKHLARSSVIQGLQQLEYRGYDSAGFVCLDAQDAQLTCVKTKGTVQQLIAKLDQQAIDGFIGAGHTRWATHGVVSDENAHPHFDCNKSLAIVHNGIIENFQDFKRHLEEAGHTFRSQTDSEAVVHLFESLLLMHQTFKGAIIELVNQLHGAYAIIILLQQQPDTLLLLRKRTPLCIGIGDNEMFVASDPAAFSQHTRKVLFLPEDSFALVKKDMVELYDFQGKALSPIVQELAPMTMDTGKAEYEHFMLKEIYEQKRVIVDTITHFKTHSVFDSLSLNNQQLAAIKNIHFIACGTSWHAASIARFFFEKICLIPTYVHLASEFRCLPFFPEEHSLFIGVSQSGETADTLEALRKIHELGLPTIALTNSAASTMVRESSGFLLMQAGREISVASTKAFTAQVASLFLFAHHLAFIKGMMNQYQIASAKDDLLVAAEVLENTLENYKRDILSKLAQHYAQYKNFIFLGRHISYPFALEAALKLKEISYLFVDCYPAGELKHGPLALMDATIPVFLFSVLDPLVYKKLVSNAQEVKARAGHLVVIAFEGQDELICLADYAFILPKVHHLLAPLAMTGLMQYFAYQVARTLGRPIDKPRNLAKSVTVE